jgi:hypothetical protein
MLGSLMLLGAGAWPSFRAARAGEPERVPYFAEPKTANEIREVVRILKSFPPAADIEYHDWTDAWTPYLMPHRLERLTELLVKLGRHGEARDTLWRICERTPVMYKGRAFHYGRPSEAGFDVEITLTQHLWLEELR